MRMKAVATGVLVGLLAVGAYESILGVDLSGMKHGS